MRGGGLLVVECVGSAFDERDDVVDDVAEWVFGSGCVVDRDAWVEAGCDGAVGLAAGDEASVSVADGGVTAGAHELARGVVHTRCRQTL